MSVDLAEEDGPGRRDGRFGATVRIDVGRGTARQARLTVTGPVRWVRFPPSCTARGTRLGCDLGELAGTTELRLAFQEQGRGTAGADRALRAIVGSPDLPESVRTVRLPERESRQEAGERPEAEAPASPASSKTTGPVRTGTGEPARTRTKAKTGEAVPARAGADEPVRTGTRGSSRAKEARDGTHGSSRAKKVKEAKDGTGGPAGAKKRREAAVRTGSVPPRAAGQVKSRRPSRDTVVPAAPAAPVVPAVPSVRPAPSVRPSAVLPAPPKEPAVALPPIRPAAPATQEPRLSVTGSEGPLADDGRGWLVVLAVALAGEMILLWFVTALALWRRRT